tara:strand:+ start:5735 stop:7054 length:1320 start_codon:yes stop_codon:yes gene_type:complete
LGDGWTLSERPLLRLLTLCILYVAQGIPFGFVTVTLAIYLSASGLEAGVIGAFTAMATLPWTFKWIWGPMIDRYGIPSMGRRRPWILLAQTGMIITITMMAFIPSLTADIVLLGWMVLIHNVFNSLQDVAVDALAVDLLREEERGRVSGLMYGSKFLGTFIGGAVLTRILDISDFNTVFVVQVGILVLISLFPLFLRERAGERLLPWTRGTAQKSRSTAVASTSMMILFRRLGKAFSLKSTIIAGVIGLTLFIGSGVLSPIFNVFLIQDLGWDEVALGDVEGGYGVFLSLAGAMLGGFLADLFGAKRIIAFGTICLGLSYLCFGLMSPEILGQGWFSWHTKSAVVVYILVSGFMVSVISVSLFSMYITISWPVVAATQFTAYMAILNLSTVIGQWTSGQFARLDIASVLFIFAGVQIAVIALLPLIDIHQTRRVLGEET